MTTLNDANQSDVSTADQTEQTTDVAIALFEEVRARESRRHGFLAYTGRADTSIREVFSDNFDAASIAVDTTSHTSRYA